MSFLKNLFNTKKNVLPIDTKISEKRIYEIDKTTIIVNAIMTIESFAIVYTTKNIDTYKNRFSFLKEKLNYLKSYQDCENFIEVIEESFENYKERYFDKKIEDKYFSIKNPTELLKMLPDIYPVYLFQVAGRYASNEAEKINNLKQVSSKIKRLEKLVIYFESIKNELENITGKEGNQFKLAEENLIELKLNLEQLKNL
ncbi:MAG: hypothetical protein COA97_01325 [Flavobacteriales bacterium]|nr:MAG: hypothetical protein COA97_01325 [Flavobacteriales bacterium]